MSTVSELELLTADEVMPQEFTESSAGLLRMLSRRTLSFVDWIKSIVTSSVIVSILIFIVVNFYVFSSIVNLDSFFIVFLLLSLMTDGVFLLAHMPRRKLVHEEVTYDPSKLTIVIACYNGQDVIRETIRQAKKQVPADQIIVMSDASTDNTVKVAKSLGVRVYQNRRNLNKAFSISLAMKHVKTPYVLILDDDTLIGDITIPTSLLDEGYTAVAFNVMPIKGKSLINELQRFEYRQSMEIGKGLRASVGAIGNISGAIGLYRTKDLVKQASRHSGQFAGEDEQRTILAHLNGSGKGITFIDETVLTQPPQNVKQLYRQRAYSWSLAVPELFLMYWKLLLNPSYHHLLKAEKAYQIYVYVTDPLRILFFWTLFMRPSHILLTYGFYLALNLLVWARLGLKDSFRSVLLFPLYSLGLTICRFIGHFYWFKVKARYFANKFHRYVDQRKLGLEFAVMITVFIGIWTVSIQNFTSDMRLFSKIRNHRLEQTVKEFEYDSTEGFGTIPYVQPAMAPPDADYLIVTLERGDTKRAIAHKAISQLASREQIFISEPTRWKLEAWLAAQLPEPPMYQPGSYVEIDKSLIHQAISQQEQHYEISRQ